MREARGAVYAATQSQNSVWLKLGGRENAAPAHRQSAQQVDMPGLDRGMRGGELSPGEQPRRREVSYSEGHGGRTTNVSFPERPILPRHELRTLPPFHVIFAPAEGRWLYRKCIAMPATPDGRIPPWWFGDWNPVHWAAHALGLPRRVRGAEPASRGELRPALEGVRAAAGPDPLALCGLDGTFIITGGTRSGRKN